MADVSASAAAGSHDPRHAPVLRAEAIEALAPERGGAFIDGTYGAGGYSTTLLAAAPASCSALTATRMLSLRRMQVSRRPMAGCASCRAASATLKPWPLIMTPARQTALPLISAFPPCSWTVPSAASRFRHDGPLDMRMDQDGMSAADFVNEAEPRELARVIRSLGEEQRARRIADAIVAARTEMRIERTSQLADIVEQALRGRRGERTHPATKTFQAIRMHVNDELGEIARGLAAAERVLKPGGRLAVVSFHSLEDRAVKRFLNVRRRSGCGRLPP